MPPFLMGLVTNIWFRRACVVAAIVAVLLIARQHYINVGKSQGAAQQVQQTANVNEQQRVTARAVTVADLAQYQAQIDALTADIAQTNRTLATLAAQRQAIPVQLNGLTAQQVQQIINQALGKSDPTQPYTLDEQRQIAGCFKDRELCNQQVAKQQEQSDKLTEKNLEQQGQYDALATYTTNLERVYVNYRNDTAQPKRKWWCAFVCKRANKITLPNPKDLKKPAATAAKEQS